MVSPYVRWSSTERKQIPTATSIWKQASSGTQNKLHPISFNRVDSNCKTHEAKASEQRQPYDICQKNRCSRSLIPRYSEPKHQQSTCKQVACNAVSGVVARLLSLYSLIIAHKPTNTLCTKLLKSKESLDKMEQSALICKIGGTGKKLGTRPDEHRCTVYRTNDNSQNWKHTIENDPRWFTMTI